MSVITSFKRALGCSAPAEGHYVPADIEAPVGMTHAACSWACGCAAQLKVTA